MGATKPKHAKKPRRHQIPSASPSALLAQSATLLNEGSPDQALDPAHQACAILSPNNVPTLDALPALALLGEIHLELGDPSAARDAFLAGVKLDPQGSATEAGGGGAEKFMWLAQLSDEGGRDSLLWFEKGVEALQQRIVDNDGKAGREQEVDEWRKKLAEGLCGMIEVWMTDLSFEAEAETQCENLITRALMVSPTPYPSTLQTLASIRLSQSKLEDAESALTRSIELWKELPQEHPDRPAFATRISLTRLLMEAGMEEIALEVVEALVGEDDESIEAWYLGGWCLHLLSERAEPTNEVEAKEKRALLLSSREWLRNCLKLYGLLEYEDERLRDHAQELVAEMDKILGDAEIESSADGEEWEDEDSDSQNEDEDHEMNGT